MSDAWKGIVSHLCPPLTLRKHTHIIGRKEHKDGRKMEVERCGSQSSQ